MNRPLWILLFAATLLAVQGVAAAAAASSVGVAVVMPVLDTLRRVEEDVMRSSFAEGEDDTVYPRRRVLQSGGRYIGYGGLGANKAACYGPCPARGQPYTGRGCQQIFRCRG